MMEKTKLSLASEQATNVLHRKNDVAEENLILGLMKFVTILVKKEKGKRRN